MPSWVPILDSNIKKGGPLFYFSSVDEFDGSPRVRTCVSRGWLFGDKATGILTLTTDKRMPKMGQLSKNDKFEGCFYFPDASIQIRISGTTQFLMPQEHEYPVSLIGHPSAQTDTNISSSVSSESSSTSSGSASSSSSYLNDPNYKLYPIVSPSYNTESVQPLYPPSLPEWNTEFDRIWDIMSPKLQASFRYPPPGSKMTTEDRRRLDSIMRGVDGANSNDGKANFVVILLLVNKVDVYNDSNATRRIYTRRKGDEWKEEDVCP